MASPDIFQTAQAKINLDLLITGRREDGYHLLDSLVVFADYGDEIHVRTSDKLTLALSGPFAGGLLAQDDNIILKAARGLRDKFNIRAGAAIRLVKNLPVSSGMGGGSADAAATIRALTSLWHIPGELSDLRDFALLLGADVPVCLASTTVHMAGVGEILHPVSLRFPLFLLLVNPGLSVPTTDIFRAWGKRGVSFSAPRAFKGKIETMDDLKEALQSSQNDLLPDACAAAPEIGVVLDNLRKGDSCIHAGMSGSGATCFGIFSSFEHAVRQANILAQAFPDWWVQQVSVT